MLRRTMLYGPGNVKSRGMTINGRPVKHPPWKPCPFPGGRKEHASFQWEFQWKLDLAKRTLCRIDKHRPFKTFRNRKGEIRIGFTCAYCWKELV